MKQEEMEEVRRVLERKDGIKMVIIPKRSKIVKGDYVRITKLWGG